MPELKMVFFGIKTGAGASGHNLELSPYINTSLQVSPITKILIWLKNLVLYLPVFSNNQVSLSWWFQKISWVPTQCVV
jgi:hypothetical protein